MLLKQIIGGNSLFFSYILFKHLMIFFMLFVRYVGCQSFQFCGADKLFIRMFFYMFINIAVLKPDTLNVMLQVDRAFHCSVYHR